MKLSQIPVETLLNEWRSKPFQPQGDFHLEDFRLGYERVEEHVQGMELDRDYLFAPLESLYFHMEAEDWHRQGQKIIEHAPNIADYQWAEFEVWFGELSRNRRLRKPKAYHLAESLWEAIGRQAIWFKVVRFAVRAAGNRWTGTGCVKFSEGYNAATNAFLEQNGLLGPIPSDDPRLGIRPPIDPHISLHLSPICKDF